MTHWLPGTNSPLYTTWFSASRSMLRSKARRTRGVLAERIVGCRSVGDVDQQAEPADRHRLAEAKLGVVAHRLDVGRQHPLDHVERARAQVGQPHRRVDDRQVGDLVDEDFVLVPVVRELLDHDAVLLDPLDEPVGPGADRLQRELVARCFGRLGRDHHAGAIGELGEQGREGLLEVELDGQRIDHVDAVDQRQLGLAERAPHGEVAVEAVLGGLGVERLAVVEVDAGPELDGQRLAVGRGLVAEPELRDDVQLVVDVEQLVADRGEDDARGIGARQARIERVRIVADADAQMRLRGDRQARREKASARALRTGGHGTPPLHTPCHIGSRFLRRGGVDPVEVAVVVDVLGRAELALHRDLAARIAQVVELLALDRAQHPVDALAAAAAAGENGRRANWRGCSWWNRR